MLEFILCFYEMEDFLVEQLVSQVVKKPSSQVIPEKPDYCCLGS